MAYTVQRQVAVGQGGKQALWQVHPHVRGRWWRRSGRVAGATGVSLAPILAKASADQRAELMGRTPSPAPSPTGALGGLRAVPAHLLSAGGVSGACVDLPQGCQRASDCRGQRGGEGQGRTVWPSVRAAATSPVTATMIGAMCRRRGAHPAAGRAARFASRAIWCETSCPARLLRLV